MLLGCSTNALVSDMLLLWSEQAKRAPHLQLRAWLQDAGLLLVAGRAMSRPMQVQPALHCLTGLQCQESPLNDLCASHAGKHAVQQVPLPKCQFICAGCER